jgi:hypothetical protein
MRGCYSTPCSCRSAAADDDDRVLARPSASGLRNPALGFVLDDQVIDVLRL